MPKILVTGSAGFIGFHTAERLLRAGWQVVGVDNLNKYYDPQLKKARNKILQRQPNYKFYKCDLADYPKLAKIFRREKFNKICHLAAQAGVRYSLQNPFAYLHSNLNGFVNILELARQHQVREIVYASSSSVYGDNKKIPFRETDSVDKPISLYAATKRSNELLAHVYHKLYGLHLVGLRFFTVYGPWGRPDMALFKFTKNILAGQPIAVYNHGQMTRDFTYISDIVDGIRRALAKTKKLDFAVLNLGKHRPEKLTACIALLEKQLGQKAQAQLLPRQPGDVLTTCADIRQAQKLLGYKPQYTLAKGIRNFVEWYKSYYRV
ncbi:UDP-N-acetylglucosamine 4-epimerase [Candidatus Termititenax persephonae]|uniref:UDP-N-acetylglucosamine 4-epimerase n=1 Tax=Candidatus Termititenax persephonae TaxID=2218525 RepID=A0A388TET9_9BACT|nr:UDP-N-acetylglucosamine 4-epimerase [Candidatus Termititenax persephonae]